MHNCTLLQKLRVAAGWRCMQMMHSKDESLPSVVDATRQRQDRHLLSSSSDNYESSESSNSDSDIFHPSVGSNANGPSTHLGKDKTVWKNSPTSVFGRTPAHNVYTSASGVSRKLRRLFPYHMMHGSTSFLKLFFALL